MHIENPDLYGQVQSILTAAQRLCAPGRGTVLQTRPSSKADGPAACGMLLKMSNPPKRQISFTLGDTLYIAQVVITNDLPSALPADLRQAKPAR
jgi:hypothetical protein